LEKYYWNLKGGCETRLQELDVGWEIARWEVVCQQMAAAHFLFFGIWVLFFSEWFPNSRLHDVDRKRNTGLFPHFVPPKVIVK
jgi:hypothetical protein